MLQSVHERLNLQVYKTGSKKTPPALFFAPLTCPSSNTIQRYSSGSASLTNTSNLNSWPSAEVKEPLMGRSSSPSLCCSSSSSWPSRSPPVSEVPLTLPSSEMLTSYRPATPVASSAV